MPKVTRWIIVMAAAAAALAWAGPDALVPLKDAVAATSQVNVAFVIDFGGSTKVDVGCVKVPSTDNEYQALAAFTQQEDVAPPTYANSGLLCSIGGIPPSGCGQADGNGYIYWSYWLGDSGNLELLRKPAPAGPSTPATPPGRTATSRAGASRIRARGTRAIPHRKRHRITPPSAPTARRPPPRPPARPCRPIRPLRRPPPHRRSGPDRPLNPHMPRRGGRVRTPEPAAALRPPARPGSRPLPPRLHPTPSHKGTPAPATHTKTTSPGRARSLPDSAVGSPTSLPHVDIQAIGGTPAVTHGGGSGGGATLWIGGALVIALLASGLVIARRRARTD